MIDFTDHFNIMESTGESSPMTEEDVREIIRSEVEKLGISKSGSSAYSVLPTGETRLGIYEIGHDEKGTAEVGTISLPPGSRIISNPVVAGDVVSFGVQYDDKQGLVRGHVHALPEGNLKYPFTVKTPSGGMRYKSVMGREDVDQPGDFEEEPIEGDDSTEQAELEAAREKLNKEIEDVEEEMRETAQDIGSTIDASELDMLKVRYRELRDAKEALVQRRNEHTHSKELTDAERRSIEARKGAEGWGGALSDHLRDKPEPAPTPTDGYRRTSADAKTSEDKGFSFRGLPDISATVRDGGGI